MTLEAPCDGHEIRGHCPIRLTIIGPITQADADAFSSILLSEASRTGKLIEPQVSISSMGGDVRAAMQIGRELRRTEGWIGSYHLEPCYSACVLVAAGAVSRLIFDVGIHRPYFVDSTTSTMSEADARYKKLMAEVRAYLAEMNISEEVFHIMGTVGPDEIKRLSTDEAKRLGFFATEDPAYEELEIAKKARAYHLTSAEYRSRQGKIDDICGKPSKSPSPEELFKRQKCGGQISASIMWDADSATIERINSKIAEQCSKYGFDTSVGSQCVGDVGFTVKNGHPPESADLTKEWNWRYPLPMDFKRWISPEEAESIKRGQPANAKPVDAVPGPVPR